MRQKKSLDSLELLTLIALILGILWLAVTLIRFAVAEPIPHKKLLIGGVVRIGDSTWEAE